MAYLLDANVFIEAKNRYYGFDLCPGFWEWLDREAAEGTVMSVEAVRDELIGYGDELSAWANDRSGFFLPVGPETLPHLQTLSVWVGRQRYRDAAIAEFLESADYKLVAIAMAHGFTVVTHETPSDAVRRVKIPEPCVAHSVDYINPFVMLRRLGARFELAT